VALTVHVDVLPGTLANEGQLDGSDSHHWAILRVQLLAKLRPPTAHDVESGDERRGAGQPGPGKLAEGVEVDIVDAEQHKIGQAQGSLDWC
jgi:hypothetical protein